MNFLNFLSNRLTLEQLLSKSKESKKTKISKNDPLPRSSAVHNSNVIDVKEPFYIDRFKQFQHKDCHIQGKCLACQYAKLKAFQLKKKNPFLHSRHNKYNNCAEEKNLRLNTQRQSCDSFIHYQNIMRKYRSSEGAQPIDSTLLIKNIKLKLKYLSKSTKSQFYEKTGKNVDDPQILELIYKYLLNQTNQNESFLQIFSKIKILNMRDLLSSSQLLKNLSSKQEMKNQKTNSTSTHQQNIKNPAFKQISEFLQKKQKKQRKQSSKGQKRKVNFQQQPKINEEKWRTNQICCQFLTGNEKQLNKQMKQILKNLANQKYKIFKQIISSVDESVHKKYNQDPTCLEKMKNNLDLIVDWIKMYISPKDNNQDLKKYQINKLTQSLQNLSKARRKSSLKNQSPNTKHASISRFNQQENLQVLNQIKNKIIIDKDKEKEKEKEKEKGRNKKSFRFEKSILFDKQIKEFIALQSIESNEKQVTDQSNQTNQTKKTVTQGTAKLIEEEMRDTMECEQLQTFSKKTSNKKSDIVQFNKASHLKHQKSKQYEIQERQFYGRSKNKQGTRKNIENLYLDKKKKSIAYQTPSAPATSIRISLKYYEDVTDLQSEGVQSVKRKKIFLKIKAAQLLRLNHELIQKVKRYLKEQNLSEFIINPTDCVLTRKKKIRILRDMIKNQQLMLETSAIHQILEYLEINEESYRILMGKNYYQTDMNEGQGIFDWDLLYRKQPLSKLLFYDLNNEFIYGNADEDEINYLYSQVKKDRSWEISSKNISADPILEKIQNQKKKQKSFKDQSGDLIQTEMSEACYNLSLQQ